MLEQPTVSIVIRTKDRPSSLVTALQSAVLQQGAALEREGCPLEREGCGLELIVINDGGDCVEALLAPFRAQVQRCELVQNPQSRGRAAAANQGLALAQGEFVGFLDDDDRLAPQHVAHLLDALTAEPDAVLAYGRVECVYPVAEPGARQEFAQPYDATLLLIENYIPIHAALFRRSAVSLPPACAFDEDFDLFEDWDFWLQLQTKGRFVFVDQLTAYYHIHADGGEGVTGRNETRSRQALTQLLAKWRPRWTEPQLVDLVGRSRFLDRQLQTTEAARAQLDQQLLQTTHRGELIAAELTQLQQERRQREAWFEQEREALQQYQHRYEQAQQAQAAADALRQLQVDAWEQEVRRLESERRNQQLTAAAELARQQQQLQDLTRSHSWRLTAPLRAVRRLLNGQQTVSQLVWQAARYGYRLPLARHIPYGLKQRLRSALYPQSPQPSPGAAPVANANASANTSGLKVSIIIPVYNHAEYLDQCISSALSQTYQDLEVVICDDCSPDPRVRDILSRYEHDPRCVLIRADRNAGISATQNRLLMAATGDIIAFLDCDDYLALDAVERCMAHWREDLVYLHTARINVDSQGAEINRISFEHLPRQDYFAENLERMFATHFKLIHRRAFARVGLFDPRFDSAQDYDMLMRIAFHFPSAQFQFVPDFVYSHRLHGKQTTEAMSAHQQHSTDTIQREARLRADIRAGRFAHKISIIMLSYGKSEQTLSAIESLKHTVRVPHEIILFDNGSQAATVAFIREHIDGRFDDLQVIYHDRNLGPAGGRREALRYATGEWFLVFDNDELAEPGWIEELLVRAQSRDNVGAVCCKVIFPDQTLQFSGGYIDKLDDQLVELALWDRGASTWDLQTAQFRECGWCPIGATLFTLNPAEFLHEGYPNCFEDAGVSMALKRLGKVLLNSPGSWVWHEHIMFQRQKVDMSELYMKDRYNPQRMLTSLKSFWQENELIIYDEYVWRENALDRLSRPQLVELLSETPVLPSGATLSEKPVQAQQA